MNVERNSLARKLFTHFILIGGTVFGAIIFLFYLISYTFSDIAVEMSFKGMSHDITEQLVVDKDSSIRFESNNLVEKWGFDSLYNNLGFRVVDFESNAIIFTSAQTHAKQPIVGMLPNSLDVGFTKGLNGTNVYRTIFNANGKVYALDLVRSDLLGELANEAVMPVITNVATLTMVAAFVVFVIVSFLSVGSLVRPVEDLSAQLSAIKPQQLNKRLNTTNLPAEIAPLVLALNQAMNRVEEGFEEQKRFVANAAHELRTPLAILQTRLEMAKGLSSVKQEVLKDIGFMSRIVEQLLDLSRAQNRQSYEKDNVSLNNVGTDMCMLLAPLAVGNNKDLEFQKSETDFFVSGDKGALSVMVKNLIENAIKHSEIGATIILRIEKDKLFVKDSGPGINQAEKGKIFERFWRKSQSNMGGSGLGLSIVNEICLAHNARIILDTPNELGGSTFCVVFPSIECKRIANDK
ncbi:sensor histidine kinase [Pseudoalteromonas arctica]|uniref:histidine kinase n=1 Tax=Pseudoalteromonas arctica TaxID=394751 RepID=A0A7Y0DVN4_9GAMM|nr:ATP-binding protein [Pseudoalteromonas arctica]NMM42464.1 two-component sensor histidine kinase [Pseudoalteromonas arctica]